MKRQHKHTHACTQSHRQVYEHRCTHSHANREYTQVKLQLSDISAKNTCSNRLSHRHAELTYKEIKRKDGRVTAILVRKWRMTKRDEVKDKVRSKKTEKQKLNEEKPTKEILSVCYTKACI